MGKAKTATKDKPVRRYRLLKGKHAIGNVKRGDRQIFHPGDVIETSTDLLKLNGEPPCEPKFALADLEDAVEHAAE